MQYIFYGTWYFLITCYVCITYFSLHRYLNHFNRTRSGWVMIKHFCDSALKTVYLSKNTQENHENELKLWSTRKINELFNEFGRTVTTVVDLKLANILCGILSHSSLYPCTFRIVEDFFRYKKNWLKRYVDHHFWEDMTKISDFADICTHFQHLNIWSSCIFQKKFLINLKL